MASNSTSPGLDSLRNPSCCLSQMLDKIIGTEEVVSLRRKRDIMTFYAVQSMFVECHYSGSKGEGLNFQSSDMDFMFIDKHTLVIDPLHDTEVTGDRRTVLMMRRDGCNPGFVILQLRNRANDNFIVESLVDYRGCRVVSSILYRDVHRMPGVGEVGHGPCNTYHFLCDIDNAHCFECKEWPQEAGEFLHRPRLYGWPQKALLAKIIRRGCHLVPIGDKDNDLSYIQWRLSFSAAEKDLVHSFTHTQFKVYAALKIFLKQFISEIKPVEDLLCSYFLKTVLFYSIESTPASFWREDLLIPCFWFCVNKLYKHIEDGYLPNYFVPQNNMFRKKVFGKNKQNLLLVFNQVKCVGWSCLCLCNDFRSLHSSVRLTEPRFKREQSLSNIQVECTIDSVVLVMGPADLTLRRIDTINSDISRALTLARYARSQSEEDISMSLLYSFLGSVGKFYFCDSYNANNKARYLLLRKSERFLHAALEMNITSGHLDLATFHYQTGKYNKAVQECQCVIERWKPFTLYVSTAQGVAFNQDLYLQYVCGRKLHRLVKARTAWAFDIWILPQYKTFYPADLSYDIEATVPFSLFIPPLPYTVFLLFLCHHKLRNIDDSLAAVRDLKRLAHDGQQGCRGHPIVFNLLAICLGKVGDTTAAVDACLRSQRLKPERNGADKLLDKLLSGTAERFQQQSVR